MASELRHYRPVLTMALAQEAFGRGLISTADLRALTAAAREERLASGTKGAAGNALREFLTEMQETGTLPEEHPSNGGGKKQS